MKPHPKAEAERWLAQARSDLGFAELGVQGGYHAQACFMCQQAGEKALKALRYFGGERFVPGHSLVRLLTPLITRYPALGDLQEAVRRLEEIAGLGGELRGEIGAARREWGVIGEGLRGAIRQVAEGVVTVAAKHGSRRLEGR